jgi:uncharacterized protein YbcI
MADRADEPQDPHPPRKANPAPPTGEQVTGAIAREIHRIHEESYGNGAERANAVVIGDFVVVVLDGLDLLPNEQFLVDQGDRDAVAQVRHQYQRAIQAPFRAAVERATGRRVVGFESTTSVEEPRFMVEVFKLE